MLMHFGMTGRIQLRDIESHMIFMENGGDKKVLQLKRESIQQKGTEVDILTTESKGQLVGDLAPKVSTESAAEGTDSNKEEPNIDPWPPRFTKFELFLSNSTNTPEHKVELAFSDPRRLARVRFLTGNDYSTDTKLMSLPPLQTLGPDYSKKATDSLAEISSVKVENGQVKTETTEEFVFGDPDPHHHGRPRLSFEDFAQVVLTKKKPIKAFLLDQDFFAGIGNWVSDEILYQARIHPGEVLSKKISNPESPILRKLYDAIIFVMEQSVRVEGNAKLFPDDWLMLHRWGKGRKEPRATTKSGHRVEFDTIGGRTSCFVPELQKALKREGIESEEAIKNPAKVEPEETVKTKKENTRTIRRGKTSKYFKIEEEDAGDAGEASEVGDVENNTEQNAKRRRKNRS
ncbi:hypothetical protein JCM33374_g1897 [Metschnikowia sp. JCM 33374]|nr:hypothetical protein JCM33374_g1897 [Metschnikowia sp. JCM 33374]